LKGCIQRKGKNYYAIIAIHQKRKWFKAGPAKRDAQKILAEKINEINQGTYKEIPKTKFREFARNWLKSYAEVNVTVRGQVYFLCILLLFLMIRFTDVLSFQSKNGELTGTFLQSL
jgi:hypothetical protein